MDQLPAVQALDLSSRLRRSQGRLPRISAVSTRVSSTELTELENAAKREGKAISEWSREQLLASARRPADDVLLTELVGLRMIVVSLLKPIALNEDYSEEQFRSLMNYVRNEKRRVTGEVISQYEPTGERG